MTVLVIPLAAVPSQAVSIILNNKNVQIEVYQKGTPTTNYGLFMDLTVDNVPVVRGVLCQNYNRSCDFAKLCNAEPEARAMLKQKLFRQRIWNPLEEI